MYLCSYRVSGVFVLRPKMLENQSRVDKLRTRGGAKKDPNWTSETGGSGADWGEDNLPQ